MSNTVETRIQIIIPTYNDIQRIDETIQSIWSQNFDKDQIFIVIVDFGSTDGTYEKLIDYDKYHMGIYQIDTDFTRRRMVSESIKLANFTFPGGEYCHRMVLNPGDIIYPDYLKTVTELMYKYRNYNVSMLISEVDIKDESGCIYHRPRLYDQEKLLDGKTEYMDFMSKGIGQNIMCFGGGFAVGNQAVCGIRNERIWWNKSLQGNYSRNAIYLPERLSCIRECIYEDELEDILLNWNDWIDFMRTRESALGITTSEKDNRVGENSLSEYALWRSFLMYQREEKKQARECFLIAGVINPYIRERSIYEWMEALILKADQKDYAKIKEYYQCNIIGKKDYA